MIWPPHAASSMRLDRLRPQSLLVLACLLSGTVQPGDAEPWKACAFNDATIPCRDSHSPDGTVRIVWQDGKAMTYRLVKAGFPLSSLRDSLGGIWERQIFVQGNAMYTNKLNGNRIFVPLRPETQRP